MSDGADMAPDETSESTETGSLDAGSPDTEPSAADADVTGPHAAWSAEESTSAEEGPVDAEALPGGDGSPPIDFTTFILSISTSAMIQLGEIADPDGRTVLDLDGARQTIEILQLLDRKTEGRLSGEEDRMLAHVIDDLRTRYLARWAREQTQV